MNPFSRNSRTVYLLLIAALLCFATLRSEAGGVTWTGGGDGVSWTSGSNWSGGVVPGSTSDVTIGTLSGSSAIAITTAAQVNSIASNAPINLSGGSLTFTGPSTLNAGFTVNNATLTGTGPGASLSVTGSTTLTGANLYAQSGAVMLFLSATNYTGNNGADTTIQASGTGS